MKCRLLSVAPLRCSPTRAAGLASAAAAIAGLLFAAAASAALYKWTDANGVVVYSDQPPPASVKVEQINAAPPPANAGAVRDLANHEAEFKKRQAERGKQDEQAAKSRADAEKKAAACARTAGQVRELEATQQLVFRVNAKGERVVLDDATRAKERQQLEKWLKANCPS
jgi:Skp family chaperone for outer membrane proteins